MLAVGNLDVHGSGEAGELAGTGVGHDGDTQAGFASIHGGTVLEREAAVAALQRSGYTLDGDVSGGIFHSGGSGQHFTFAGAFEVAVKLLVNGHASTRRVGAIVHLLGN